MDKAHTPVILVVDRDGAFHGVITLSRVLAAIATAAGQDSPLVRRRLERDVLPAATKPDRRRGVPCTVTRQVCREVWSAVLVADAERHPCP